MHKYKLTFFYCFIYISSLGSYFFLTSHYLSHQNSSLDKSSTFLNLTSDIEKNPQHQTSEKESSLSVMPVNDLTWVSAKLSYKGTPPSLAEAINQFEFIYASDNKVDSTFSIIDSKTEILDSHKIKITMHLATKKPGLGKIVYKDNGEVIWSCKIIPENISDRSTPN